MISEILGQKIGMTQIFSERGEAIPVTVIKVGPCYIVQKKTEEKDGYKSLQMGILEVKENRLNKPKRGHLKKANVSGLRMLREIRVDDFEEYKEGQKIGPEIFKVGDYVDIQGISRGHGFQGGVKRWHFRGGPKSHGQSDRLRAPGSIGQSSSPSRVFPGTKMAGHMGTERVTVKNLKVMMISPELSTILVGGAVPGRKKGLIVISKSKKKGK